MNKILIALDYHPTAEKVAEQGYALAKSMCAEVVLVHVIADMAFYSANTYDPIMGFNGFTQLNMLPVDSMDRIVKKFTRFLNLTKKHLADDTIQIVVKAGDVATVILETAQEEKATVIVLGSHSQKWLEHLIMGSVSEKVLQQITIPLYFIPTKKE